MVRRIFRARSAEWFLGIYLALAMFWSGAATALLPASPEQMACLPSTFVVATVTSDSPSVSVPDYCRGPGVFCHIDWPVKIKVDEVLATRPSSLTADDRSILQV